MGHTITQRHPVFSQYFHVLALFALPLAHQAAFTSLTAWKSSTKTLYQLIFHHLSTIFLSFFPFSICFCHVFSAPGLNLGRSHGLQRTPRCSCPMPRRCWTWKWPAARRSPGTPSANRTPPGRRRTSRPPTETRSPQGRP